MDVVPLNMRLFPQSLVYGGIKEYAGGIAIVFRTVFLGLDVCVDLKEMIAVECDIVPLPLNEAAFSELGVEHYDLACIFMLKNYVGLHDGQ